MQAPLWHSRGWQAYMLLMLAFNAVIWIEPLLEMAQSPISGPLYVGLGFTCHQLDSRSLCIWPQGGERGFVGDCTPQDGKFRAGKNEIVTAASPVDTGASGSGLQYGYKIPVCSRDISIYGGMLLGGLLWLALIPRLKLKPSDWPHPVWLVLALVPLAVDGFTQLFGWQESTNAIRLWTGLLAGVAMAFYALPSFYILLRHMEKKTEKK